MSLRLAVVSSAISTGCALWLSAIAPMQFAIAVWIATTLGMWVWLQWNGKRRYELLAERVESIKGVRSTAVQTTPWEDPIGQMETLAGDLVTDLEESYFRLVKTNIQLLSLKEVGRSIIASLDQERTVQSVLEYLQRGVGFKEFGLLTWRAEEGVFVGGVRCKTDTGFEWVEHRFALPECDGILAKSLGLQRSYLIKDAERHPLGSIGPQALFPQAGFGSFVVVPLLQNPAPGPVWERRGCAPAGCPAAPERTVRSWVDKFENEGDPGFWEGGRFRCWSCAAFPVLGCVLVTDTGRDTSLSKIDLIMLETLAQNLSTVLENSRLYEDLKHEELFRERVIHSMSDGLLSVDMEGRIVLFNQAAERLSGYTESDVRGRQSGELVVGGSRARDPLRQALAAGRSKRGQEATLRTASGKLVPIRLNTSLLRDEKDRVYGAIGEFADQSAIKGMEAQIRHLDKLAAIGRFTSSIAHEIRNPLAGITAGIQYMRKRMEGPDQAHVDFILAEAERMNRIIEDLLRAGRPLELSFQDTDLEELVERSIRTLEPRFAERRVECVRRVAPNLPKVAVDADRIEQVLINLVQNAVEASPEDGKVEIELGLGSSQEPVETEPDSLVIRVRNEGEGISEDNRDKIFEPFFTTKARGTGLGLYVCHHIIEGHGGTIAVDTSCGEGTRFLMSLPLGRILLGGQSETADSARR